MAANDRWQALQAHLARAQDQLGAGDRAGALEAVDAALAIDPDFLAAHALRDRILADVGVIATRSTDAPSAAAEPVRPLVSPEGYARFEQRARRRRVDRRLDAARAAVAEGRRKDAASAINEIHELDPSLPELRDVIAAYRSLPVATRPPARAGRWLVAAAVFGAVVLGATWVQESGALGSRSMVSIAPLVAPPEPLAVTVSAAEADAPAEDLVAGTSGDTPMEDPHPVAPPRPTGNVGTVTTASATPLDVDLVSPAAITSPLQPINPPPPATTPAFAPIPSPTPAPVAVAATAPPTASPSPAVPAPNDELLVKQTLQRYRSAYEGLDAHSARAVWPAVNETALAHAFDGLQSQSLIFDACSVTLHGEAAGAVCRGTTRYVPKIGSREPRVEPRTWNFTLRRAGSEWMIESARAEK